MLMHDICRQNAWKHSARVAVTSQEGVHQTWAELDERADRVADALYAAGVRQGDRVSCILDNCLEIVALFFACSRLGAVYAPVNYRFVLREKRQVLEAMRPRVVVVKIDYRDEVEALSETLAEVAAWPMVGATRGAELDFERWLEAAPSRDYDPPIDDDDAVFICHTGGSTGMPKGVALSHRNMCAAGFTFILAGGIREEDVYLAVGALFYIALAVPIAYWIAGARVVIANFDAVRTLELIERDRVTHILCTATIFKITVDEQEARPRRVHSLSLIYCGGAPVSGLLIRRAERLFGCPAAQIYGQTEVTLMGTYLRPEDYAAGFGAEPESPAARRLESVGRAAPLVAVGVFGEGDERLPAGEIGEIAFRGDAVMLGYAGEPELSAETVRGGWLFSGDIGYVDEDGYVYLVDRKKDMIISGGENVYSREVELLLAEHPRVSECVVIGVPDDHWGERVHALVIPRPGAEPDAAAIRAFCRERLAAYKVPKAIEFRADFPRLATGKIAKQELREEFWVGQNKRIHGT